MRFDTTVAPLDTELKLYTYVWRDLMLWRISPMHNNISQRLLVIFKMLAIAVSPVRLYITVAYTDTELNSYV